MAAYEQSASDVKPPTAEGAGPPGPYDVSAWPRWLNIALGLWLFISAFAWTHSASSMTNTWIVGLLITAAGIAALYAPAVRWANTALAVWLFVSTLIIQHTTAATTWHNAILAVVVGLASLTPTRPRATTGPRARATPPLSTSRL